MRGQGEERVTARLEWACGHVVERLMLAKHRRMYCHAGNECLCPVHDVMEVLFAVEEVRVPEGWRAFRDRLGE
jgi:hypothetical protein